MSPPPPSEMLNLILKLFLSCPRLRKHQSSIICFGCPRAPKHHPRTTTRSLHTSLFSLSNNLQQQQWHNVNTTCLPHGPPCQALTAMPSHRLDGTATAIVTTTARIIRESNHPQNHEWPSVTPQRILLPGDNDSICGDG